MPALATCPHCATDQAHASGAVALTCAVCGKPFALPNAQNQAATIRFDDDPGHLPAIPDLQLADGTFKVIEEINRGGMGIVLRGRDEGLHREVAIKVIRDHRSPIQNARFIKEAQVTGQLEHPNIVPVHAYGTDQHGRAYFAMKLVRGRTLASIIAWHRSDPQEATREFPLTRLVNLLIQVCNAVAFAHARGVIHRDIKPSNIMIGDFGEVMLMDWGLAKVGGAAAAGTSTMDGIAKGAPGHGSTATVEKAVRIIGLGTRTKDEAPKQDGDTPASELDLTHEGSVIGTPVYMSPEQAQGLSGQMDARSDIYALGALLYELLTLHPPVGGADLKEVLANAAAGNVVPPLERTPKRDIPRDLAAVAMKAMAYKPERRYVSALALRRDLESWIEGRSVSAHQDSLVEVAQRLWRRNRLAVAAALTVGVVLLAAAAAVWVANLHARNQAERARHQAEAALAEAERQRAIAEQERTRSDAAFSREKVLHRRSEAQSHLASIALAGEQIASGDVAAARSALDACPIEYRDWAWHRLDLLCQQHLARFAHGDALAALAVAPGGRHAAAAEVNGLVTLYDLGERRRIAERRLHPGRVRCLALADGPLVASGGDDGAVRIWNGRDEPRALAGGGAAVTALAMADDGLVAGGASDGTVRRWSADGQVQVVGRLPDEVTCLRFDGQGGIIAAGLDGTVRRWNRAGQQLAAIALGRRVLALAGDGQRALVATDRGAEVLALAHGRSQSSLKGLPRPPAEACFLADDLRILGGGDDGTLRLWEAATGRELLVLRGHAGAIGAVASRTASADHPLELLSGGTDATLRWWDGDQRRDLITASLGREPVVAAVHPDGARILAGTGGGSALIWDLASRQPAKALILGRRVRAVAFSPDGTLAAAAGDQGACRVWSVQDGRSVASLDGSTAAALGVAFHPDGKRLAVAGGDGLVRLHELPSGRESALCRGHTGAVNDLAFAPDGATLATAGADGTVRLFDAATGNGLRLMGTGGGPASAVAFASAGDALVVAVERCALVLGVADGAVRTRLAGHAGSVRRLQADQRQRAITSADDGTMRLWDLEGGRCLMTLRGPDAPVLAARIAGDTATLIAVAADGMVYGYPASK